MGIGYLALGLVTFHIGNHAWEDKRKFDGILLGTIAALEFIAGVAIQLGT